MKGAVQRLNVKKLSLFQKKSEYARGKSFRLIGLSLIDHRDFAFNSLQFVSLTYRSVEDGCLILSLHQQLMRRHGERLVASQPLTCNHDVAQMKKVLKRP